jgi:arylformamidase
MSRFIDISVLLHPDLPTWPDSHGVHISRLATIDKGDDANVSRLDLDLHSGTHIDAPHHFMNNGITTEQIPLETLIGTCFVADMRGKTRITAADLDTARIPKGTRRLLFKTDNSNYWADLSHSFRKDFCALTADGAQWVVDRKIELVGIDYHSIQLFHDPFDTHVILLKNEVVILEGLDLREVTPDQTYRLMCLPIKVKGVDGVSSRAVLEVLEDKK